jgi:hypothetical protein
MCKICKAGPQVDFKETQGLLCKMVGNFGRDLFSMDKAIDRVHASVDCLGALGPSWTDGGVDRGGGRGAVARSPELGLQPLRCTKAHQRGHNTERSAWGARLGPHRGSGGVEEDGRRR